MSHDKFVETIVQISVWLMLSFLEKTRGVWVESSVILVDLRYGHPPLWEWFLDLYFVLHGNVNPYRDGTLNVGRIGRWVQVQFPDVTHEWTVLDWPTLRGR